MTTEQDNINSFDKLLKEKERLDKLDKSRYRYFEDLYGNEYRYTIHPQDDGKFHVYVMKIKRYKQWGRYEKKKDRAFKLRRKAKQWAMEQCMKASNHQQEVLNRREEAKQQRALQKHKPTKSEIVQNKLDHNIMLAKRCETKIKSYTTRLRKYQKKIKYYQKELLKSKS